MSKTVLIVDDEASIRESLKSVLSDEGYRVETASNANEAIQAASSNEPDLVLLDIWMKPGRDGIEVLRELKSVYPEMPIIMMSGHGNIETAVKSVKYGAYDFVEKPLSLDKLLVLVQNAIHSAELARENQVLRRQVVRQKVIIGDSAPMQAILDIVRRVGPTTGSVLITGENGTGKEMIAHAIHAQSPRFSKPMIEVNCAAIPEELIESELFGHEKGAFTGAHQSRRGKFDLANGGTLFLDEIGDMSLKTQAKILRILQEQKFERVGSTQSNTVDVRIIAATNKDLRHEIANGRFREDLFFRLKVVPIHVPPLRDRPGDVPLLATHFMSELCQSYGRALRPFSNEALAALSSYRWPGNVRELKNLVERIVILTRDEDQHSPVMASEILEFFENEEREQAAHGGLALGFGSHSTSSGSIGPQQIGVDAHRLGADAQKLIKNEGTDGVQSSGIIPGSGSDGASIPSGHASATELGDGQDPSALARNLRDARQEFEREFILNTLKQFDGNVTKAATALGIERAHLHRKIKSYGIET